MKRKLWIVILFGFLLCGCPQAKSQTPVVLAPDLFQQFLDANGVPLSNGCLYSYLGGTSTPTPTYTDSTGVTQNPNPIILTAGGFSPSGIWIASQNYRFVLFSSGGVNCATGTQQRVIDFVNPGVFLSGNNAFTGNNSFAGTTTFNGALVTNAGGTLNGSFGGNPNFTGSPTFSGAPVFPSGITSASFTSTTSNPAAAGTLRLAHSDVICWRNFANSGDVCEGTNNPASALTIPSDWLTGTITDGSQFFKITGAAGLSNGAGQAVVATGGNGDSASSNAAGGAASLQGGLGFGSGAGGGASLTSGAAGTTGSGGNASMLAGNGGSVSGTAGAATVTAGTGVNLGGTASLIAGAGTAIGGTGGAAAITGGAGGAGAVGGAVNITAGSALAGGNVNITPGNLGMSSEGFVNFYGLMVSQKPTPTLTGTGACATITTQTGAMTGHAICTGTTGASTFIITSTVTAPDGMFCSAYDVTTNNVLRMSVGTTTACTISGTVNANDRIVFFAAGY